MRKSCKKAVMHSSFRCLHKKTWCLVYIILEDPLILASKTQIAPWKVMAPKRVVKNPNPVYNLRNVNLSESSVFSLIVRPSANHCFNQNYCSWVGSAGRSGGQKFRTDVEKNCRVAHMKHRLLQSFVEHLEHKHTHTNTNTQTCICIYIYIYIYIYI